ncbi:MAG: HAD-IIA family hydrolase [Nitrospiraceae bacterium]|nr:HAD-IIA family hydrolase [Nitrospiraceae bacterium]
MRCLGASKPLRCYDGYVFDLDGTIYLGDELLPGALDVVTELQRRGARLLFLSNNPTRDPAMYVKKLASMGLDVTLEQILNPVVTMSAWLKANMPDAAVFVIGEGPLQRAIANAGLRLSDDPSEIDVVVASYDRGFTYQKLQIAFDAMRVHRRARLVTTNPDAYCPMPGGRGEPDSAAIVAAIEACTGAKCEANLGKPDRLMIDSALGMLHLQAHSCLLVGDRLYTDIAMAIDSGMDSALVLSGESSWETVLAVEPDRRPLYVLEDLYDLLAPR